MSNSNFELLDWIVAMDIQYIKTEQLIHRNPSIDHPQWYIKGSLDIFTNLELLKIFSGKKMTKALIERWNCALTNKNE
jgi:hypothetical protein